MKKRKIDHYSGIGGQAVLEGVMMRNKDMYAVAVRKPDGDIAVEIDEFHGVAYGSKLLNIPFIRGVFVFIDSLLLGIKVLTYSSSFYEELPQKPSKFDEELDKVSSGHEDSVLMILTTVASFVLAIALFMVLPYALSELVIGRYIRNASLTAIIEGVLRILIFIIYILIISGMKDIKRLFRYHGAEHKCINCIEKGKPLTTENVKKSSRLHKRCGSSFILFVMFVSIVVFFFIRVESVVFKVLLRILLIPVISGISYEIIRIAGRSNFILIRIISAPGFWLQRLTTKEPNDAMIEVAIKSVEAVFDWKQFLMDSFGYDVEGNGEWTDNEALSKKPSKREATRELYERKREETKEKESKRKAFAPPSPEEVAAYCREHGLPVDPDQFCSYYDAVGWMVGSHRMKDWQACLRTWAARERNRPQQSRLPPGDIRAYSQRDCTGEQELAIERMMAAAAAGQAKGASA